MYNLPEIAKITGVDYGTVWARACSKYAKKRWGVVEIELPDGSVKKFVPKDKIHLWVERNNVIGRPTNEELEEFEK